MKCTKTRATTVVATRPSSNKINKSYKAFFIKHSQMESFGGARATSIYFMTVVSLSAPRMIRVTWARCLSILWAATSPRMNSSPLCSRPYPMTIHLSSTHEPTICTPINPRTIRLLKRIAKQSNARKNNFSRETPPHSVQRFHLLFDLTLTAH